MFDKKVKVKNLTAFILDNVTSHRSAFDVSDVHRDGTVFVKFRSTIDFDSDSLCSLFSFSLLEANKMYTQVDDRTFRVALNQF